MTILHLGVVDIPYAYDQEATGKRGQVLKRKKKVTLAITTGEVGTILEGKYHIMEFFYETHKEAIGKALAEAYEGAFHRLHATGQGSNNPAGEGLESIQNMFKLFLSGQQMDGIVKGVATQAAQDGVSHRFAHPYAKRDPRPSFIDTGTYQSSMRAWIE